LEKNAQIEEKDFAKMRQLFTTVCPEIVRSAVRILESMEFEGE